MQVVHEETRDYKCDICFKEFTANSSLTLHLNRIHSKKDKQNKFLCSHCDKSFISNQTLKYHEKLHLGEPMNECSYCKLSFIKASDVKTHVKIVHLEIREFKCEYCSKCFSLIDNLSRHVETVHKNELPQ